MRLKFKENENDSTEEMKGMNEMGEEKKRRTIRFFLFLSGRNLINYLFLRVLLVVILFVSFDNVRFHAK